VSSQPEVRALTRITEGQEIPFGGDRVAVVSAELAESFRDGDRLIVVQSTGALLLIPAEVGALVADTVAEAGQAFSALAAVTDDQITDFFDRFAEALSDDDRFAPIAAANAADVTAAAAAGRSTTRLVLDERMRSDMVSGLLGWRDSPSRRDGVVDRIEHDAWSVEARRAPLGVVGFVFEGRPNVFADACGVVRTGNAVVFRIGSDALGTARRSSSTRWPLHFSVLHCRRAPSAWSTRRRTPPAMHCSPIDDWRSPSPVAPVRLSANSVRSHRSRAHR
jgi:glutamate-5-semialdehyde dehydrogenase